MKRLIILCITLSVLIGLTGHCLAAEVPLEVLDTQAKAGQTVYLAVTLNESVVANTIGVKCEFDKTLLTAMPELCTWGKSGTVSAFKADNLGAWTSQSTEDIKGKLCVLAFQVNEGVAFSNTAVKCTVTLKNSAKEVGNYTTEGKITSDCDHNYGAWESTGKMNHTRICDVCGGKSTQQHQWDEGAEKPGQQGVTLLTKTCLVCREQKILEISVSGEVKPIETSTGNLSPTANQNTDKNPSKGEQYNPGQPSNATKPNAQASSATKPNEQPNGATKPQPQEQDKQEGNLPNDHDHTHEENDTIPEHTHSGGEQSGQSEHSHTGAKVNPATVWVVVGLIALTFVGAFFALRKKQ